MGPKTFFAALMCLIIVAFMCSPLYLVWLGFTLNGSALVRIGLIVVGLILWRALKKSPFLMTKTENAYDL